DLVESTAAMLGEPPTDTTPLIVLRHAKALARKRWDGADPDRPLEAKGTAQADRLAVLLACFGIERVVSSDSLRCVDTVHPYATATRAHVELEPRVTEEAHETTAGASADAVTELVHDPRPAVLCSHRPVLPTIFEALGKLPTDPFTGRRPVRALSPGAFVVLHRRFTQAGVEIVGAEHHEP
ncbi:MAG: phosphoglycerate mutase family protein, partial [Jiangellales bacterium]